MYRCTNYCSHAHTLARTHTHTHTRKYTQLIYYDHPQSHK